jgi:hypothetical protein
MSSKFVVISAPKSFIESTILNPASSIHNLSSGDKGLMGIKAVLSKLQTRPLIVAKS